jgi:hypothetical protein
MKVQVSHRLDRELLAWATEYGESRRWSRAVVIEEALRHFKGLSAGGVPDDPPAPERTMSGPEPVEPLGMSRQRRLAKEMGWAS